MDSGKFKTKTEIETRMEAAEKLRSMGGGLAEQTEDEIKSSEALARVASEHVIESVTAITLAYVMSKAANVFPAIGGCKVEHLKDTYVFRLSVLNSLVSRSNCLKIFGYSTLCFPITSFRLIPMLLVILF